MFYRVAKKSSCNDIKDLVSVEGFEITPKNKLHYDGVEVTKLVILKHAFVECMLKRKVKRKIEGYLDYVIDILDSDDEEPSGSSYHEVLNDLSRYRDILRYKYTKYLGEKYTEYMLKKIDLLEYELKLKSMSEFVYDNVYNEDLQESKSR